MTWNEVTVERVVQETPLDRTFHLALAEGSAPLVATPGQYIVLRDPDETPERDWYFSLSGATTEAGGLRITVRGRGDPVQRIYAAAVGTRWIVQPPAGDFHITAPEGESVVLVSAGAGVTPFRAFLERRIAAGRSDPVWLFHCARTPEELLFHGEFQGWAEAESFFRYVPMITTPEGDPAWTGHCGRVEAETLRPALQAPNETRVFACGPGPFVEAALAAAETLGVPDDRRLREAW